MAETLFTITATNVEGSDTFAIRINILPYVPPPVLSGYTFSPVTYRVGRASDAANEPILGGGEVKTWWVIYFPVV